MTEGACFICAYADRPCDRAELHGELVALRPEVEGASLRLRTADGGEAELVLRPPWQRLVGDLERHGLSELSDGRPISLAAYHLQLGVGEEQRWLAGPESLVVLEPEWLEDVTNLTRTQYCERHYLLPRYQPEAANEAILRGSITHATFRQIVASPRNNDLLQRALEQALRASALMMAGLGVEPAAAREAALPALRALVGWARRNGPSGSARTETFLLAHRLGMRGRIDAAWEQDGRIQTVAELKSGKTWRGKARVEHELQVGAYGLMLAERGVADLRQERLLLLYAGNIGADGGPDLERQVPIRARSFANLVHFRNRLVLIDLTGRATYQGPNRCRPCRLKRTCHRITELLEAPRCAAGCVLGDECKGEHEFQPAERAFFRYWVEQLNHEWQTLNDATARLWRADPASRCTDGTAAGVTQTVNLGSASVTNAEALDEELPGSLHRYLLQLANDCELRQGDRVLLSDERGPVAGQIAQVEVETAGSTELTVLAAEPLSFDPRWIDQYGSERLFLRAYAGLYGWLAEPPERRALVTELHPPRFKVAGLAPRRDLPGGRQLNARQAEALATALRAEDYLCIQGPPGSGKTELVAALARQLTDRGGRVLLLAGTNRALDRLLAACAELGLEERCLRLGGRAQAGSAGERRLLDRLAQADDVETTVRRARELLDGSPIVAATIATLTSGPYSALHGQFDSVVLDEASQVTLPASLGVVGFGRRFVLVGDHRQLPPVVQSSPPAEGAGLGESLFERLARAREADDEPGLVRLDEQYRMNAEICGFPSRVWYEGRLKPAGGVAGGRLRLSVGGRALPDVLGEGEGEPSPQPSPVRGRGGSFSNLVLDPERPIVFVDVPGSTANAARRNRREARLARALLEAARERGLGPGAMAVMAPFRAQVALIRAELAGSADEALRAKAHEIVDTVDRFQGSERDLVIYSCSSFAPEPHPLMIDERRLNVALTRARHKLVVLGDLQVMRRELRYAQLEDYCRSLYSDEGGVVDSATFFSTELGYT